MTEIIKANGQKEEFSEKKLRASIARAGIPQDMQDEVVSHILPKLRDNMHTSEIYQHVLEFLHEKPYHRAKYSLKQSLMDLGPTGFPFEDYLSMLLKAEGYETKVRQIITGKCITHEVDVVAQKGSTTLMVEAKFHNSVGIKTDVQVALYTQARFEDTSAKNHFTKPMLITNTKITSDVIAYAQCVGMDVLSWEYPEGNSLRELVERYNLFPITALTHLPKSFQQQLLEQNIVLCKDVCLNPALINQLNLSEEEKTHILKEAAFLCTS